MMIVMIKNEEISSTQGALQSIRVAYAFRRPGRLADIWFCSKHLRRHLVHAENLTSGSVHNIPETWDPHNQ